MLFPRDVPEYCQGVLIIPRAHFLSCLKGLKEALGELTILYNTNASERSQTERNLVPRVLSFPSLATRL